MGYTLSMEEMPEEGLERFHDSLREKIVQSEVERRRQFPLVHSIPAKKMHGAWFSL